MRAIITLCLEQHELVSGQPSSARVALPPLAYGPELATARKIAGTEALDPIWRNNTPAVAAALLIAELLHVPTDAVLATAQASGPRPLSTGVHGHATAVPPSRGKICDDRARRVRDIGRADVRWWPYRLGATDGVVVLVRDVPDGAPLVWCGPAAPDSAVSALRYLDGARAEPIAVTVSVFCTPAEARRAYADWLAGSPNIVPAAMRVVPLKGLDPDHLTMPGGWER